MSNIIRDILIFAKATRNIKFMYCNRSANKLTDKIVKEKETFNLIPKILLVIIN